VSTVGDLVTMGGGDAGRLYKAGAVPDRPTYPYRVLGYAPAPPVVRNQLGQGDPVGRFYVQHFARTADSLEDVAADTFTAFDGKAFAGNVVSQEIATPIDRDPDDRGVLTTTHTYRF
jgi:hypothetical protein